MPIFEFLYKFNPGILLHGAWMSDEASGPEFVGKDGRNTDEDVDDKGPDDSDFEIIKV